MNTYTLLTIFIVTSLLISAQSWQTQTDAEKWVNTENGKNLTYNNYVQGSGEQKTGDSLDKSIGDAFKMSARLVTSLAIGFNPFNPVLPPKDIGELYIPLFLIGIVLTTIRSLIAIYTALVVYDKFKNKKTD